MYCGRCGRQNPKGAAYCVYCGLPLAGPAVPAWGPGPLPPVPLAQYGVPRFRRPRRPLPNRARVALCLLVLACVGGAMFGWVAYEDHSRHDRAGDELAAGQQAVVEGRDAEAIRRFTLAARVPEAREGAIRWLLSRTTSQRPSERTEAVDILDAAIPQWPDSGAAAEAVPGLIRSLTSSTLEGRLDAVRVLGRIGDRRAIGPLLAAILPAGPMRVQDEGWRSDRYGREIPTGTIHEVLLEALAGMDADWHESAEARAAVPDFIAALKSPFNAARGAAADWLGLLGDRRAIRPLLVARLEWAARRDEDRWQDPGDLDEVVFRALGRIDPDWATSAEAGQAVPVYVAAVDNTDQHMRQVAVKGLCHFGGRAVIGPLLLARLRETDRGYEQPPYDDALAAADAHWASLPEARAMVPRYIDALDDASYDTRIRAAWGLGEIGDGRAIVPLLRTMTAEPAPLDDTTTFESLARIAPDWVRREETRSALPMLAAALGDPQRYDCRRVRDVLERIAAIDSMTPEVYLSLPPGAMRRVAAEALEPYYLAILTTSDGWTVEDEVAAIGDPRLVPRLLTGEAGWKTHEYVNRALRLMNKASRKPLLLSLLYADEQQQPDVLEQLEDVLGEDWLHATEEISGVLDAFLAALKDADVQVRLRAACWLGRFGRREAVAPLVDALRAEKESAVVSAAQTAIAQFNSPETLAALEAMSKDADATVRQRAAAVLDRLRSTGP